MARLGRPTKLTPRLAKAIVDRVKRVFYVATAAQMLGISGRTAMEWVERGEKRHATRGSTSNYARFAQMIKQAQAEFVDLRLTGIAAIAEGGQLLERQTITKPNGETMTREKYSEGQWTAHAWPLERVLPDQFGKREPKGEERQGDLSFTFIIQRGVPGNGHGELTPPERLAITAGGNGHGTNGDGDR